MPDVPKPGNGVWNMSKSLFGKSLLWQHSSDKQDTSHLASISTCSNSEPSLPLTPPSSVSCPSSPAPSFSRPSSPAEKESHPSNPLSMAVSLSPLPDSRVGSSCSIRSSNSYQSHQVLHTSRSMEHSPVRRNGSCSGRWISSPKLRKHCSEPPVHSSPLRAPPMVQSTGLSSSSASTASSDASYTTDTSISTAPTSLLGTPRLENEPVVAHDNKGSCKSFSDSITETCDKLCEKLRKSLRVMWRHGKRSQVEQGGSSNIERGSMETEMNAEAKKSETPKNDGGLEDTGRRWGRKSVVGSCHQKRDSIIAKVTETIPEPSNSESSEKPLPPVSEVADFMDLRDPFACHTSGALQVVKNSASALPPPSSFRYTNKVVEARRRAKHPVGSLGRTGSAGRSGSAARPGSSDSNSGIARLKFDRRMVSLTSSAAPRRPRPLTPRRATIDSKPFPASRPITPRGSGNSKSPFTYTLAPVRPLRVVKLSTTCRSTTPANQPQNANENPRVPLVNSIAASQRPTTPQRRLAHVAVKSSSPFSSPSSRPMTPPKRTKPYSPFALSISTSPATPSTPSTPALSTTSSSPPSPLTPVTPTSPFTPSYDLPQTPTPSSRKSGFGIRPAKSRSDILPPVVVLPPADGRIWL